MSGRALSIRRKALWAIPIAVAITTGTATAMTQAEATAREILDASGVRGGAIVHLGCGDGELTAALRANDRYVVHGLDPDAANVAKARRTVAARGLYGPVTVSQLRGKRLPYADSAIS